MNEVIMLHGTKSREILQSVFEQKIPIQLSYQTQRNWHRVRMSLTGIDDNRFYGKFSPQKKTEPVRLETDQPVGVSIKYGFGGGYDKLVFGTIVIKADDNGAVSFAVPEETEIVPRRSYFRVPVLEFMKVNVEFRHRYCTSEDGQATIAAGPRWEGNLIDISAGGLQIAVDAEPKPDFNKGDAVGIRFRPMPNEAELMFNAQVSNVLPTADEKSICIGLEIVGLEASPEGRLILQRLCNVVDEYHRISKGAD